MLAFLLVKKGSLSLTSKTVTVTIVLLLLGGDPLSVAMTTNLITSDISNSSLSSFPLVEIMPVVFSIVK